VHPLDDDAARLLPTAAPTARRFRIAARAACMAALEASFAPARGVDAPWLPARGRQDVTVQERLAVVPAVLRLPADIAAPHAFTLRALGGSGAVEWRIDRADVAGVGEAGVVTARGAGMATVTAVDRRNPRNRASATVAVTPVAALRIAGAGDSRAEVRRCLTCGAGDRTGCTARGQQRHACRRGPGCPGSHSVRSIAPIRAGCALTGARCRHNVSQLAVGWASGDAATITLRPAAAGPAATDAFALREARPPRLCDARSC
jgi:hypothetical protein